MRATLCALALLLAFPAPLRADAGLEAAVAGAYGARQHSDRLHQIAHERVLEIVSDWSHNGQDCCWEVLAFNQGFPDPVAKAVAQWQASPGHHAILADPNLTEIGCAEHVSADGTHWFACVLDDGPDPVLAPAPAPAPVQPKTPAATPGPSVEGGSDPVTVLPDTAMGQ